MRRMTPPTMEEIKEGAFEHLKQFFLQKDLDLSSRKIINIPLIQDTAETDWKVSIVFSFEAYYKMVAWTENNNQEVCGHGIVHRSLNEDGKKVFYYITDYLIYPQHNQPAHCESNDAEYGKWLIKQPAYAEGNIRMQHHSHVRMSAFQSGQDAENFHDLAQLVDDYYVFLISNQAGQLHKEIWDHTIGCIFQTADIQVEVELPDGSLLSNWLKAGKDMCSPMPVITQTRSASTSQYESKYHYKQKQNLDITAAEYINARPEFSEWGDVPAEICDTCQKSTCFNCPHYHEIGGM